ncbi:MAG: D-glycerate dehydrogenase [Candidatus Bathyarchaeota archaeon]|nr:D-glycerate dehydrogenase [Candidatus Bathyarchaeota archaeon]
MKPNVLCSVWISEEALKKLEKVANVETRFGGGTLPKQELLKIVGKFDGVIIGGECFDKEVINAASRLKVISRRGVGYDKVNIQAASERGIYVTLTPVNAETVADVTFGLILAVARKIPQAHFYVKDGEWETKKSNADFRGLDVFGKTIGIIGLGRIGSIMAKRARGFDMDVLYNDLIRNDRLEEDLRLKFVRLDNLLSNADVITIHTSLNEKTKGMIGEKELRTMKKTAILINTARGPIVDQTALYSALKERWIAGAGLDVFMEEPLNSDDPLLALDNVVLLPHIGSETIECRKRMSMICVDNTIRALRGEKPIYCVTS